VNFVLDCTQRERKKESLTFPPTHWVHTKR
jgi:hypothetical protein